MLDHRGDRRVRDHRGAQRAESPGARVALLEQSQRGGGGQQSLSAVFGHGQPSCQGRGVHGAVLRQGLEQLGANTGKQHL